MSSEHSSAKDEENQVTDVEEEDEENNEDDGDDEGKTGFPKIPKKPPKGLSKFKLGGKPPKIPKLPKISKPPKPPKVGMSAPARKKTMVQGMIDVALLSSNIGHLRDVLDAGSEHKYYDISVYLISSSIGLQMLIGIGIAMLPPMKFFENLLSTMIYIVLFLNLFITAFALIKK
uniref:CSON006389 protein n=1 Tax=Culicoides sonorensis TaxID=179676 RepID=A0A336MYF8_CULSO